MERHAQVGAHVTEPEPELEPALQPEPAPFPEGVPPSMLTAAGDDSAVVVMVFGTGKNGKSTMLNALLGEDLLPSGTTTCTGNSTEIGAVANAAGKEIVRLHRAGQMLEQTEEVRVSTDRSQLAPSIPESGPRRRAWCQCAPTIASQSTGCSRSAAAGAAANM